MSWMWWVVWIVLVGEVARAVLVGRRAAVTLADAPSPVPIGRLEHLDRVIVAAEAQVAAAERDGAPVASAGPLALSTHRLSIGHRSLPVQPGLRVVVDAPAQGSAPVPPALPRRRSVVDVDGTPIALPSAAAVADPLAPRAVVVTVTDGAGTELQLDLPAARADEARSLAAHVERLLGTERAVLEARRGIAVGEATVTLLGLRDRRDALIGLGLPGGSGPPSAGPVVVEHAAPTLAPPTAPATA